MADARYRHNPQGEWWLLNSRSSPVVRHMIRVEQAVKGVAARLTPVDTGFMRQNNDTRLIVGNRTLTVRVFNPTNYAVYVHQGTRYMRARPWLENSVKLVTGKTPRR